VRPLAHAVLALLLVALQGALLRYLGGGTFSLCLVAAVLVHLALHAGNVDGAVGAAGVGYVLDLATGTPKGLMTSLAVAVFVVTRLVGAAVHVRGRAGFAALTAAAALGLSAGALALQRLAATPEVQPSWDLWPRLLVEALLSGAAAPLVLLVLRRLDALLGEEEPDLIGS
jgi:rod shape-determining protein MreD